MTPREDLRGQAPREVLLAHQDHISRDVEDRAHQWTLMGRPPRGLDPNSHAFRLGGFGRREVVKYYDLVRELLYDCWERLLSLGSSANPSQRPHLLSRGDFLTSEVPRLEAWRDAWIDAPDRECHGRSPRTVIDHERARLPEGLSDRFCETLTTVAATCAELDDKCADVQQRLRRFLDREPDHSSSDDYPIDDLPF